MLYSLKNGQHLLTHEERCIIEEECVVVASLHPELRPTAEEILNDLIHDKYAIREIYEERVQEMYRIGHNMEKPKK